MNVNGRLKMLCFCAVALSSYTANAGPITETTDAGRTMETAFVVPAGTTSISGTLGPGDETFGADVDLYQFTLGSATSFTIQVNTNVWNPDWEVGVDPNVMVFNASGQGLAGNDDWDASNNGAEESDRFAPWVHYGQEADGSNEWLDSLVTLDLEAGTYFFAVGDDNIGAYENMNLFGVNDDFIDNDTGYTDAPLLKQPTAEVLGFVAQEGYSPGDDYNSEGGYTVYFGPTGSGAGEPIPEPGTLALLGLGAAAAGVVKRRRQKRAAA